MDSADSTDSADSADSTDSADSDFKLFLKRGLLLLLSLVVFSCLVSPRSYILTLIPTVNKFHKQTNKKL